MYYQFVARDWLPQKWADPKTGSVNNVASYKKLGDIVSDGRMAGILDWTCIVDRTREMGGNTHWTDPAHIIDAVSRQYQIDKWMDQPMRPEVWVEKDALEGVVGAVCRRMDVPFFSCRGYTSLSSIWENAQRLKEHAENGYTPVILHLGDHDPSGIDMSRDIQDRVRVFMDGYGNSLEFDRLALNRDQVDQYNPPENPAKSTDSRYQSYVDEHGESSWELDALDPDVISNLIEDAVLARRDDKIWERNLGQEQSERLLLKKTSKNWTSHVVPLVKGLKT